MTFVARAVGAAAAAGVEHAAVERAAAAEAVVLAAGERGRCRAGTSPGRARREPLRCISASIGDDADPVLLERLLVARVLQRVGVLRCAAVLPPRLLELRRAASRRAVAHFVGRRVVLGPRHVGQVVQRRGSGTPRCRASPDPCPVRSTLPLPSGQPSWSASRPFDRRVQVALGERRTSRSRNALSPVQRQTRSTALGNFTVSSVLKSFVFVPSGCRLRVVAEVDGAVGHRLVGDDARVVVEDVRHVAQRAQVRLDRPRTARPRRRRRRCTRRRSRRSTGSRGSRRRSRSPWAPCRAAAGNCLPWLVQRICRFFALSVRSARFCLPQSIARCSSRSPGSVDRGLLGRAASRERHLGRELPAPGPAALRAAPSRRARPWSDPATASQMVFAPLAGR